MAEFYPPVTEVGLIIQFAEDLPLTLREYAEIIQLFAPRYPEVSQAPAFERMSAVPGHNRMQLHFGPPPVQLPRLWLIAPDGKLLIQVHNSRFALNWRRLSPLQEPFTYPGYEQLEQTFLRELQTFLSWAAAKGMAPKFDVGELLYQNQVSLTATDGSLQRRLSDALRFFTPGRSVSVWGFNAGWLEELVAGDKEGGFVQVATLAGPVDGGSQIAEASIVARFPFRQSGLDGVAAAMRQAHSRIHETYPYVLSEDIVKAQQ